MEGIISLDTLHLVVKYPSADVFRSWYRYAEGVEHRKLKEGIPVGDFVVRGGASVYKVSVWQHDARVFLTHEVDEIRGEGKGCGVWVQLGPKFLIHHATHLHTAVNDLLQAIGIRGEYPTKITRLDLSIDLFGVELKDQEVEAWRNGWVGRSKVSRTEFNSRTSNLETIYIGSRQSSVYLRIYDKVAQAAKEGDLVYWLDVWNGFDGPVSRVEWEVKPPDGNFSQDLQNFQLFNGFSLRELLNYLLDWGRLCIPDTNDSNNRRWQEAPLWETLRRIAAEWSHGVTWPTSRYGKEFHGISDAYVKFLSGTIAGGMARFGENDPTMLQLFEGLENRGQGLETMKRKAVAKAAVFSKL